MTGAVNDRLRWLIGLQISLLGWLFAIVERARIASYRRVQASLGRRLGIRADTPIRSYGPAVERDIAGRAAAAGARAGFALTSGSSAAPKRLLYTPRRLLLTKLVFIDAYARACRAFRIRRRSLFLLSSLTADDSLTSRLLAESGTPTWIALLQAPYRVQALPVFQALITRYGATAVRLFLLTLTNPGVLYATNPSTLSTFLDDVATDWAGATALVRVYRDNPGLLPAELHTLVKRLTSWDADSRLAALAACPAPVPIRYWAPGVEAYMTWTGGYVAPFLERLRAHLPPERYRLIPMYSMSTETIETLPHFGAGDEPAFLPLGPGVLYEFLELEEDEEENEDDGQAPDDPARLRSPAELEPGHVYTLVVSDGHGLRRYQTGDLFLCRRLVRGLPDLAFVRRRGLEHSFTGEKLTAEQASGAFERARAELHLPPTTHLALVPSWPAGEAVPHYRLVVLGLCGAGPAELAALADRCQAELEAQNPEYRSKTGSARLGRLRAVALSTERFARIVGGERHHTSWEAQFKFLPLYRTRWESWSAASNGGAS